MTIELPFIVAVDGPAGSGKSSVSKAAARRLGFAYLDTGAAYRALAWHALASGLDLSADAPEDVSASIVELLPSFAYEIGTDPDEVRVRVGDEEVTDAIREPVVSAAVSRVARVPEVRARLTELFRSIMLATERPGIIVEGRDITTVVAPDAPVRILLTASEEARIARRTAELGDAAAGAGASLKRRDRADGKVVDFMNAAAGVTTVDSTELDFGETVDAVVGVIDDGRAQTTRSTS
ncbi:(d)CMP kinase [Agromyces archimandritae]|uniref:Cytidylate kinase n=1 Tax=Agromyces archimandritae TaxID=2781962 RepID=A0A975FQE1_9MICO|nr:(d)CMP kinase [Agromyces archimandritae]QTX06102.1 (d)CMP kinase [Agromyces archimandritae]